MCMLKLRRAEKGTLQSQLVASLLLAQSPLSRQAPAAAESSHAQELTLLHHPLRTLIWAFTSALWLPCKMSAADCFATHMRLSSTDASFYQLLNASLWNTFLFSTWNYCVNSLASVTIWRRTLCSLVLTYASWRSTVCLKGIMSADPYENSILW